MNNLEPLNWIDKALDDLMFARHTYRAYSPWYQYQKWLRED